jgi:drug/metabolite transporter (DMT)-like permease
MQPRGLATFALTVACAAWGISFVFIKDVDRALERALGEPAWLAPCWIVAVRFLAAGSLMLPFVRGLTRAAMKDGLLLALPSVAGYLLQVAGMRGLDAGTNAFLTSLYTPLTPLLAWLLLRRAPSGRVLAAVPVAVTGVALLTRADGADVSSMVSLHATLVMLGAVCWALQILGIDRWARRHPPASFSCALFLWIGLGGLLSTIVGAFVADVAPARLMAPLHDDALLRSMAGLVLVSTIVAMVLINAYQPALDPSRAALLYTLEPAFAAAFAFALHGEAFRGLKLAGCVVLLLANVVVEAPWPRAKSA